MRSGLEAPLHELRSSPRGGNEVRYQVVSRLRSRLGNCHRRSIRKVVRGSCVAIVRHIYGEKLRSTERASVAKSMGKAAKVALVSPCGERRRCRFRMHSARQRMALACACADRLQMALRRGSRTNPICEQRTVEAHCHRRCKRSRGAMGIVHRASILGEGSEGVEKGRWRREASLHGGAQIFGHEFRSAGIAGSDRAISQIARWHKVSNQLRNVFRQSSETTKTRCKVMSVWLRRLAS